MEKWYELLKGMEVEGYLNVMSLEDLHMFERDNDVSLPEEYKNFCQVFGSGSFGNEIRIFCPPEIEETPNLIDALSGDIDALKKFPGLTPNRVEQLTKLFKNILMFGSTGCADVFLWDLSTSNDNDTDYDIYMTGFDSFCESEDGAIEIVGRNFYSFIKDSVLDNKFIAPLNSKFTKFMREIYDLPDEMLESKFIPLSRDDLLSDYYFKSLIQEHPIEFANWLLGNCHPPIIVDSSEISFKSYEVNALVLKMEDIILQIEVRTRPDSNLPKKLFNDYVRLSAKFPQKRIRQFVIYLRPTSSTLVQQNSYEAHDMKHEFDVIRLWEQPTEVFLGNHALVRLAVLSNTSNKQETLRQIAKTIQNVGFDYTTAVLAWLVLDNEVVSQILQLPITLA